MAVPSGPAVALGRRVRARFDARPYFIAGPIARGGAADAIAATPTQRRPAPHERGRLPRGRTFYGVWRSLRSRRASARELHARFEASDGDAETALRAAFCG